jgi:molybdopterin molybdotransferase
LLVACWSPIPRYPALSRDIPRLKEKILKFRSPVSGFSQRLTCNCRRDFAAHNRELIPLSGRELRTGIITFVSMTGNRMSAAQRGDVRLRGFPDRTSVEEAIAWVDALATNRAYEEIDLEQASGRVLAAPIHVPADIPLLDCAAIDGYALRSADTVGASNYNPLLFTLAAMGAVLPPNTAKVITAGSRLPEGADAVLPFEAGQPNAGKLEVLGAIASGNGVLRRGQQAGAGNEIEISRPLRPHDLGFLAALGVGRLPVVRPPRVRLLVAGLKSGTNGVAPHEVNTPMLSSLIARDGGRLEAPGIMTGQKDALAQALAAAKADVILVCGRTGTGPDDEAPVALASAGELAIHGIAMRPGGSAGMGRVGLIPVFLLPGDPLACLYVYEFFAGRFLRRLAGRHARLPYPMREIELGRKIVSTVGLVDVCRVRLREGKAEPIGSLEHGGLVSAVRADGFVVVPAPSEGYAPGARVMAYMYEGLSDW